jgi:threonine synthase
MASDAIKSTNGIGIRVSDEEIFEAQRILAKRYGILAEPAASASFAGYLKLDKYETETLDDSLLMITGNGLKDINALSGWNDMPRIKNYSSWKEELS